jgi:predicted permease
MRWRETLQLRLRSLLFRKRAGEHLHAEMQFHLEALIAENIAAGMSTEEARYAAMRVFGNATVVNEQTQETWGWTWLERLLQDIRFATRQIRRAPGFALIAILTLALGIGANNAVFTLTHAMLLSSVPVAEPDRLVRLAIDLTDADPTAEDSDLPLSLPMMQALNRRAKSFDGVFGWSIYAFRPEKSDNRRTILGATVSGNAFQVLGLHAAAGRLIQPADDQPGGGPDGWAGVISYRDWVQRYHMDPSVVGRHIVVTDHPVTIVGVAPMGFEGMLTAQHPDLYLPLEFDGALNGETGLHDGDRLWLVTFARLRHGESREAAQAEMTVIFPSLKREVLSARLQKAPDVEKARLAVRRGNSGWSELQQEYAKPLVLLQMLVLVVLLICCANLSGLFLARAAARQQEFAIRAALGAARRRLMRQLLVESLMLALPGAFVGVALAWLAGPWVVHLLGSWKQGAKISLSMSPDLTVLSVTAACAVLCALLFGMAPAWAAGHTSVEGGLRATQARVAKGSSGARRFFVPFQVALSLVLVVVAALLGSTVMRLRTDDSGYRTKDVYFYITDFNRIPQKGAALLPLYRRMIARMNSMPGIISASVAEVPPLFDMGDGGRFVAADAGPKAQAVGTFANAVGRGFFETVGTPFVTGRDLRNDETDADSCILNQAAAARFFPKQNAMGQMLLQMPNEFGDPGQTQHICQVVGIVKDSKYFTLVQEKAPIVYLPISARLGPRLGGLFLTMHARSETAAEAAQRTVIDEVAPTAPLSDTVPFTDVYNDSIARERLLSALSGFFAVLGLLLSGIGIYGLLAWSVTQRTREIGVRMALGATRMRVFLLVMRQVAILLAVGVLVGGVAAFFAARSIRSFLFEVEPGDPAVFGLAALALVLIGLLAAMLPARRAVSIDPMQALRTE